jgi:hypothetical protein
LTLPVVIQYRSTETGTEKNGRNSVSAAQIPAKRALNGSLSLYADRLLKAQPEELEKESLTIRRRIDELRALASGFRSICW